MKVREGNLLDPIPMLRRTLRFMKRTTSPPISQRFILLILACSLISGILFTNGYAFAWKHLHGYETKTNLMGVPVFACGDSPSGLIAFGGNAKGIIAIGGSSQGVVAIGGLAIGVIAIGGGALGIFSFGGISIGLICAIGGGAFGFYSLGGGAFGGHAYGGLAGGYYEAIGHEREFLLFHD